jgi:hypothetical protein
MSILYTLIARGTKTILCEFTDHSGNFQQVSMQFLPTIKKDHKNMITYNE